MTYTYIHIITYTRVHSFVSFPSRLLACSVGVRESRTGRERDFSVSLKSPVFVLIRREIIRTNQDERLVKQTSRFRAREMVDDA